MCVCVFSSLHQLTSSRERMVSEFFIVYPGRVVSEFFCIPLEKRIIIGFTTREEQESYLSCNKLYIMSLAHTI